MNTENEDRNKKLSEIIHEVHQSLTFNIFEIGALPIEGQNEPFHQLIDLFPGSQIVAFETNPEVCEKLNNSETSNLKYYPVTLGKKEEVSTFYETNHPMCSSLYKPDENLMGLYHNLEVASLKSASSVETTSLDHFVKTNNINDVDFIKIDIQGAELDVFEGGAHTLKDVIFIVSEVEFIPLYIDQPLFGDVNSFLNKQKFSFHKFLGISGRPLRPILVGNDPNFPSQHMWSDAIFIKNIFKIPELSSEKLLKMGILSYMYGSPDLAFYCLKIFDEKNQTEIHQKLLTF